MLTSPHLNGGLRGGASTSPHLNGGVRGGANARRLGGERRIWRPNYYTSGGRTVRGVRASPEIRAGPRFVRQGNKWA